MKSSKTKHCVGCRSYWVYGVKDGKHDNWCCKFGKPSQKAEGHCRNIGAKILVENLHE